MGACTSTTSSVTDSHNDSSPTHPNTSTATKSPATADTVKNPSREPREQGVKQVLLLLLGPGESGKSTFFKQLKIIQENGISPEERMKWKNAVHMNTVSQMKILIEVMKREELEFQSEEATKAAEQFLNRTADDSQHTEWQQEIGRLIKILWADGHVKRIYAERDRLFSLNDGACFFFDHIDRLNEPNYCPTERDMLAVRIRSATFEQAVYTYNEVHFKVWDIGGQIPERRKWRKHIQACTAVVFFSALTEYNQKLREDPNRIRLHDTLEIFRELCHIDMLKSKPVILVLNKLDLFIQRVTQNSIRSFFPEYKGSDDWKESAEYIRQNFISLANDVQVYSHFLSAIDTEAARPIWFTTRDILLKKTLEHVVFI